MIQDRVADIRDVLVMINSILAWQQLSKESRQQLLVFKAELQTELRSLMEEPESKAA